MKKSFIMLSVAALLFTACSNNQSTEHDHSNSTHQHDDGSAHQNHEKDTVKQEEFAVPTDTSMSTTEPGK